MVDRSPLRTARQLAAKTLIAKNAIDDIERLAKRYAIAITPAAEGMIGNAPEGPIGLQFVPDMAELAQTADERNDPIGDAPHSPVEGIVHRYPDRVLLKAIHVCPVYCRFCFRREMVGPDGLGTLSPEALETALSYIASDTRIWEVILSGGDPLMLSPRRLDSIMSGLAAISHVKVVRLHSRVPAMAPERIDAALIDALKRARKAVYVALHANHADEMTSETRHACARLIDNGIPMVSQSVLLRGINDTPEALEALMRAFVETRIKPYYLHHPDLAPGTSHFRLPVAEGQKLVKGLRGRVSGLCQPTYILDIPGGHGKTPLTPCGAVPEADGMSWTVEDPWGGQHPYPPKSADPSKSDKTD